jgi:hypothetical protein
MKNLKYQKLITLVVLGVLIYPSMAMAVWWNPFTWKIFQKKEVAPQVQVENKANVISADTTPVNNSVQGTQTDEVEKLKKEVADLKKQVSDNSKKTTSTPTPTPTPVFVLQDVASQSTAKEIVEDIPIEKQINEGELYMEFVKDAPYSIATRTGVTSTINLFNQTNNDITIRGLTISLELHAWGKIDETGYTGASIFIGDEEQTSLKHTIDSNPQKETIYFKKPITLPKYSGNQIYVIVEGSEKKTGINYVKFTIEDIFTDGERDFDGLPKSIMIEDSNDISIKPPEIYEPKTPSTTSSEDANCYAPVGGFAKVKVPCPTSGGFTAQP